MRVKPSELFDVTPSRSELMMQNVVLHEQLDGLRSKVNQVENSQVEKVHQLEASAKKVNELQAQVSLLIEMIKDDEEASEN